MLSYEAKLQLYTITQLRKMIRRIEAGRSLAGSDGHCAYSRADLRSMKRVLGQKVHAQESAARSEYFRSFAA